VRLPRPVKAQFLYNCASIAGARLCTARRVIHRFLRRVILAGFLEPASCVVTRSPSRPSALAGKVFQAHAAVCSGLITHHQLRSTAWRRLFRGVYADRALADTHRLRCHAAAAFVLPKEAIVAGRSAVTLYGVGLAEATDPIEVLVPLGQRFGPTRSFVIHTGEVGSEEIRQVAGVAVTDPIRTCWDLAQWLDLAEAVVLIDRMLGAGLVRQEELDAYGQRRTGDRGWRRFTRAAGLADSRAGSPQETRLRVRLALRGLRAPEVQHSVYGEWGFVLGWTLPGPN
jgi:hypothetical protein